MVNMWRFLSNYTPSYFRLVLCSVVCVSLKAVCNVFHRVFLVCLYILALGLGSVDQQMRKTTLCKPCHHLCCHNKDSATQIV